MKFQKTQSSCNSFRKVFFCILMVLLCLSLSLSVAMAKSNGNSKGNTGPHGNAYGRDDLNLLGNSRMNAHNIGIGADKNKVKGPESKEDKTSNGKKDTDFDFANLPEGHVVKVAGKNVFVHEEQSDVFVKVNTKQYERKGTASIEVVGGKKISLCAGDSLITALSEDEDASDSEPTVPEQIGAKGPNPTHGGYHYKKGEGNPGGGNGNGHWGEGNRGNGVGNIWTGNQGRGVGEGMAGGTKNADEPVEDDQSTVDDIDEPVTDDLPVVVPPDDEVNDDI
jgi:hypothetical protein